MKIKSLQFWRILGCVFIGMSWILGGELAYSAEELSYEKVHQYHQKMIEGILQNYVLDQEVQVSFVLERNTKTLTSIENREKKSDSEFIDVPGLYVSDLKGQHLSGQNSLPIWEQLAYFRREFTIVKKSSGVDQKEIELLQRVLKEKLRIGEKDSLTVREAKVLPSKPRSPKPKKEFFQDLKDGVYQKMVVESGWIFGLIFLLGILVAWQLIQIISEALKNVGKSIESAELGVNTSTQLPQKMSQHQKVMQKDLGGRSQDTNSHSLPQDAKVVYQQIHSLKSDKPSELKFRLWREFPKIQSQLGLLGWIEKSNTLTEGDKKDFREILMDIFGLNQIGQRAKHGVSPAPFSEIGPQLAGLVEDLAMVPFQQSHPLRDQLIDRYFPAYGGQFFKGVQRAIAEKWAPYIYTAFPEETLSYVNRALDTPDAFDLNLVVLMSSLKKKKDIYELEFKALTQFLDQELKALAEQEKEDLDPRFVELFWKLSEEQLEQVEQDLEPSEAGKLRAIPRVAWIDFNNTSALREFLRQLNGTELKILDKLAPKFQSFLNDLDQRSQLKIRDRLQREENHQVDWMQFRNKIVNVFPSETSGFSEEQKPPFKDVG